ncbi:glycosyltransferase [Dictyobacter kobayashii]|uniref:glycosyltransferase n=1 Tax=Dictyobacter kobayashii TaxID=2014872 RepID=UPI001386F613|nr:glycosyltransferase [Dictyobacter kobayashii]
MTPGKRFHQQLNLPPQTQIVLYQGNIQANRSLERLIYAARFLDPDIVIVLMGRTRGKILTQLEALIAQEGVADRVKILPPVPYAELLSWTASADLGLTVYSPGYSDNVRVFLPNKLFEYFMAGLPVLSAPLEAVTEIITRHDTGVILSSLEPEDVGSTINTLLKDSVAWNGCISTPCEPPVNSCAGKKKVLDSFNYMMSYLLRGNQEKLRLKQRVKSSISACMYWVMQATMCG